MHDEVKQVLRSFGGPVAPHEPLVCNYASPDVIALLPHTRLLYMPAAECLDIAYPYLDTFE